MMTFIQSMPKSRLKKRAFFTSIATVIALLSSSFSPLLAEETLSIAERQARINDGFRKGKTFYDAGKFDDAYREWKAIDPYLDETSSVRKVIEFLKKRTPVKAKALASSPAPALEPAPVVVAAAPVVAPGPMPALIDEAVKKLEAEEHRAASEAAARTKAADENKSRQATVDAAFERGKQAYEAGDLASAISAWKEAAGTLGDESLLVSINDLERRRQAILQAPAEVPAQGDIEAPAELKEMLEKAAAKSDDEARLASGKRSAATGKISRRQQEVSAAFEKGRRLYDAGDLDGALVEWETLAPSVEDGQTIRTLIASIRADREAARKASERPAAPTAVRAPKELLNDLESASERTKAQVAEARARIVEAEKASADSSAETLRVRESFEAGRALFQSGKIAEAIAEWEKLPASAGARASLSKLKENYRLLQETKKVSPPTAGETRAFSPKELEAFLDTASRRMKAELSEAEARRAAREKPVREREGAVQSLFENGKLLYYQGRYDEALAE